MHRKNMSHGAESPVYRMPLDAMSERFNHDRRQAEENSMQSDTKFLHIPARPLTPEQQETLRQALAEEESASAGDGPASFAGGEISKFWPPGKVLRVYFMGGSKRSQKRLMKAAQTWAALANIQFVESTDRKSEVRISFFETGGIWAMRGNEALGLAKADPTANCAGYDAWSVENVDGSALMLFGTILGLAYEWDNPNRNIPWDKAEIYADLKPQGWTMQQVEQVFITKPNATGTNFTAFDPKSIMCSPIPENWTLGTYSTQWNNTLSDLDKQIIAKIYPR